MENVVVSIFAVESEAFQAFTELRQKPQGEGYNTIEAALISNKDGAMTAQDSFAARPYDAGQAGGLLIGSLVGILGGPFGVLLGASYGALVGSSIDMANALDTMTAIEVLAGKVYEGETAIVALVTEEEPAFDAAFSKFQATIIRYDAADILEDVDRAYEAQAEANKQALAQMKADRKEERAERREARRAKLQAKLEEYEAAFSEPPAVE